MYYIAAATGISGFIGKHFFLKLLNEYDFVISYRREGKCEIFNKSGLIVDVNQNYEINKKYTPSVFYNLATYYNPNPKNIQDVLAITESNIVFPLKILSKLKNPKIRFINFCSYLQLINKKISSPYITSKEYLKVSLEPVVGEVSNVFLFDTYGNNDLRNKVVDVFIRKILSKEVITIPDNEIKINLSEISDICSSISPLSNIPVGESCIHSPFTISLFDLAYMLMEIIGHETVIKREKNKDCFYSLCEKLPLNIYQTSNKISLKDQLKRRVYEIKKA